MWMVKISIESLTSRILSYWFNIGLQHMNWTTDPLNLRKVKKLVFVTCWHWEKGLFAGPLKNELGPATFVNLIFRIFAWNGYVKSFFLHCGDELNGLWPRRMRLKPEHDKNSGHQNGHKMAKKGFTIAQIWATQQREHIKAQKCTIYICKSARLY